ncbi:MAG: hypothetical protein KAI67_03400 [Candidatus Pacebacteria bacterium]|nr:hypothetical protein [Candidatus Paceibacterota bacterium]
MPMVKVIKDTDAGPLSEVARTIMEKRASMVGQLMVGGLTARYWIGVHKNLGPIIREGDLTDAQFLQVHCIFSVGNWKTGNLDGAKRSVRKILLFHQNELKDLHKFRTLEDLPGYISLKQLPEFQSLKLYFGELNEKSRVRLIACGRVDE